MKVSISIAIVSIVLIFLILGPFNKMLILSALRDRLQIEPILTLPPHHHSAHSHTVTQHTATPPLSTQPHRHSAHSHTATQHTATIHQCRAEQGRTLPYGSNTASACTARSQYATTHSQCMHSSRSAAHSPSPSESIRVFYCVICGGLHTCVPNLHQ